MKKFFASQPTRIFDKFNPRWDRNKWMNPIYVNAVQREMNNVLRVRGYVTLNEVLEALGFERTIEGGMRGWIRDVDPSEGDGYIDFGIWAEGLSRGKDWLQGGVDAMKLYFNVDRVDVSMPRRVKQLRAEGKI